jgi:O-antigen/teichoic acid export membrane protein
MGIIKNDSIKITVISYLGAILGYVNKILLFPNFLTTEQVGLSNILISIAAIYAQFSALGTMNITLKFFPFYKDPGKGHNGFLFWSGALVSAGFTILTIFFLIFKTDIISYYGQKSPLLTEYYLYLIPLGLATLYYSLFDTYLRSLFKTVVPAFVNEIGLRILITLCISLYAFKVIDFEQFVVIYILANSAPAFVLLVYIAFLKQLHIKPVYSKTSKRLNRIIINYGLVSFVSNISNVLLANIDALMLAGMVNLHSTGIFTTVAFMSTIMMIPYRAMVKVSGPLVAEYWKNRHMDKMQQVYTKVSLVNAIIGMYIFLGLWENIGNIFYFMPEQYSTGKYVFLFLSLGRLFDMISGLNGVILVTSKKFKTDLLFTFVLITIAVVSNTFLIRLYDMDGAALATLVTLVSYNTLRLLYVKLSFGLQPFDKRIFIVLGAGAATAGILWLIPDLRNVYLNIIVRSTLVTLIFLGPVYLSRMSPELNSLFNKQIKALLRLTGLSKTH